MRKRIKRILLIAAIVLASAALLVGAMFLIGKNRGKVNVFPVQYCAMDSYWGDQLNSYGTVKYDRIQAVYLSDTMKVTQVHVQEG